MKNILKIFSITALGLVLAASCSKDQVGEIYTPGSDETAIFAFSSTAIPSVEFSQDNPVIEIDVFRSTLNGPSTVNLTNTQTQNINGTATPVNVLDIPALLTFSEGSYTAKLKIGYNETIEAATNYNITISMEDGSTIAGGNSSVSFSALLAYTWESLGLGQIYDNLVFGVDLDGDGMLTTKEEFAIQDVEILKAVGYDRWRVVNPWGNRDAVALSWGSSAVLKEYSAYWELYLKEDGLHLTYDNILYPGILYESLGEQIVFQLPSTVGSSYVSMDNNILFDAESGVFILNPAACIENTTNWFGQVSVYVALPGVDLGGLLGL